MCYDDFFNDFIQAKKEDTVYHKGKLIGLTIDQFSDLMGRVLIVGNVTYICDKSFRCNDKFESFKEENRTNIPTFICLVQPPIENSSFEQSVFHNSSVLKTLDNFFVNQPIPQAEYYIFGVCKGVRKFYRNKQMYIKAGTCILRDGKTILLSETTIFDCIYQTSCRETSQIEM